MTPGLFDQRGNRKYLVARERLAFVVAALEKEMPIATFCVTLALTGARISEVLTLTPDRIDVGNESIVFETLKQRKRGVYRAVPVPAQLTRWLQQMLTESGSRIWPWGRTTAWKLVKAVMSDAKIPYWVCKPKAIRHAFAVEAGQRGIPLNIVQRWLGHARLETTAIYSNALGEEERNLAQLLWKSIEERL